MENPSNDRYLCGKFWSSWRPDDGQQLLTPWCEWAALPSGAFLVNGPWAGPKGTADLLDLLLSCSFVPGNISRGGLSSFMRWQERTLSAV